MTQLVTHDVAVTRLFDATVEQVWAAWTEDTEVMKQHGPDLCIDEMAATFGSSER